MRSKSSAPNRTINTGVEKGEKGSRRMGLNDAVRTHTLVAMHRLSIAVLFTILSALACVHGQDPNKKFEVYPVGIADFDTVLGIAKEMASPEGKIIGDEKNFRIIV